MKNYKKLIAMTVIFTFLSLLQISAMPLRAEQAPAATGTSIENPEQAPNFIEEEGGSGYQAKKKSIVPVVLIGLGVVAVAAVLFLVVLKTKYDIVGSWSETNTIWTQGATVIVFSGDKKSGTLALEGFLDTGTYTVDGRPFTSSSMPPARSTTGYTTGSSTARTR